MSDADGDPEDSDGDMDTGSSDAEAPPLEEREGQEEEEEEETQLAREAHEADDAKAVDEVGVADEVDEVDVADVVDEVDVADEAPVDIDEGSEEEVDREAPLDMEDASGAEGDGEAGARAAESESEDGLGDDADDGGASAPSGADDVAAPEDVAAPGAGAGDSEAEAADEELAEVDAASPGAGAMDMEDSASPDAEDEQALDEADGASPDAGAMDVEAMEDSASPGAEDSDAEQRALDDGANSGEHGCHRGAALRTRPPRPVPAAPPEVARSAAAVDYSHVGEGLSMGSVQKPMVLLRMLQARVTTWSPAAGDVVRIVSGRHGGQLATVRAVFGHDKRLECCLQDESQATACASAPTVVVKRDVVRFEGRRASPAAPAAPAPVAPASPPAPAEAPTPGRRRCGAARAAPGSRKAPSGAGGWGRRGAHRLDEPTSFDALGSAIDAARFREAAPLRRPAPALHDPELGDSPAAKRRRRAELAVAEPAAAAETCVTEAPPGGRPRAPRERKVRNPALGKLYRQAAGPRR